MIKTAIKLALRFLFLTVPMLSFCQVPDGGIMVNRETGTTYQRIGNCTITEVAVADQDFSSALKVEVGADVSVAWDAIVKFPSATGLEANDVVLVAFYARTTSSLEETGEGSLNVIIEHSSTYEKQLSAGLNIGGQWKEYYARTKMQSPLTQSQLNMIFHIGFPSQTIEIANVRYLNYKNTLELEDLPETGITYIGQDENASWRAPADERIAQIRKGGASITVLDENGNPLEGAQVHIEMEKHQFGFGTAISSVEFNRNSTYRNKVFEQFNEVVFENDLKWPQFINGSTHAGITTTLNYLDEQGIPARGHNVIWPSFRFSPQIVEDLKDNPEALRYTIDKRINEVVEFTRGRLNDWDVINEPYSEHDIQDILGDEVMADWFKRTRSIDRGVKLYLNDYSILSGAGNNIVKQDYYYGLVQDIEKWGGEVNGIGMQGHFGTDLTSITKIYDILERFSELEKDIKITEFDVDMMQRDVQARYTRDFMTIVFSHPSVKSIMVWGFWASRHWKPEAAFYEQDWSIRPHGEVWEDMIKNQWWTPAADVLSDADGTLSFEGFLGDFSYTLTSGDMERRGTFSLDHSFQSGEENIIILSLDESIPSRVEIIPSQEGYICSGESVTLQGPDGEGLSYLWEKDGVALDQMESSITIKDSGFYTLTLSKGAYSQTSAPYFLEVREVPVSELNVEGELEFCFGESVTFGASAEENSEYDWYRNDYRIQWGSETFSASTAGNYQLEIGRDGCVSKSPTYQVEVLDTPDASIQLEGESAFCSGGSATLKATVQSGLIYNWYRGEELLDETGPSLTVSEAGSYSLVCSNDDCSASSEAVEIEVLSASDPQCTVGIGENLLETLIYPNPFQGSFHVDLPYLSEGKYSLELYNAIGKLVHLEHAEAGVNQLSISVEAPGLYQLRISRGEEIQTFKLINQ